MTIASDIKFSGNFKAYDNKLTFDYAVDIPKGAFFARDSFDEAAHSDELVFHPEYNKLVKGTQSLFLMKGAVKQIHQFETNQTDMEMVAQYSAYLLNDSDIKYQVELNRDTLEITYEIDYCLNQWQNTPGNYVPNVNNSRVELQEENNACACILRIDGEPDAWTSEIVNITSGNNFVINKEGNSCYIVFSGSVNELNSFELYELTQDTLEVTANEDVTVLRIYRD